MTNFLEAYVEFKMIPSTKKINIKLTYNSSSNSLYINFFWGNQTWADDL